jgi:hypothetical protein
VATGYLSPLGWAEVASELPSWGHGSGHVCLSRQTGRCPRHTAAIRRKRLQRASTRECPDGDGAEAGAAGVRLAATSLVYASPGLLTDLRQSTNDRNRNGACFRLRERFPSWEAVRDAPVAEVEEAIRPGGISRITSARIRGTLAAIAPGGGLPRRPRRRDGAQSPGEAARAPRGRAQDRGVRAPVRARDA